MLVLNHQEISELLDLDRCIAAVEEAFRCYGERRALSPGLLHTNTKRGEFHLKTGGLELEKAYFGMKVNGRFSTNQQEFGLPNVQGIIYLADGENGTPLALMDSMYITILRTGAATAVAAKSLAKEKPAIVTVCGVGKQGRIQLSALSRVRTITRAYAYSRDPEHMRKFSEEMSKALSVPVEPAPSLEKAISQSNIVVTCTPSREFFLRSAHVAPGTFISAIGSDSSYKQELEPELVARSKVVADITEQAAHVGELHHAIEKGLMTTDQVYAELGEIVAGKKTGRDRSDEVILFDATGTAMQDVAAAVSVYRTATDLRIGFPIRLRRSSDARSVADENKRK